MKLMRTAIFGSSLLLVSGLFGCDDKASMTTFFGPEDQSRRVFQATNSQANCGAREDATLYPVHFTDGRLNSLGAAKLARVVPDEADTMVRLYLDIPDNDMTAPRKEAVSGYLRACGVDDAHLALALGPNPNLTTPSAPSLEHFSRTDTGGMTPNDGSSMLPQGGQGYGPQSSPGTAKQ
jgi:hypothetical protein